MFSVILLNYNNFALTEACVRSLWKNKCNSELEIVIVDNGSTRAEVDALRKFGEEDARVKLVFNDDNLGFSKGCNIGAVTATGDFLWFLNNDSWVINLDGLDVVEHLLRLNNTGLIGNSICLPDGSATPNVGLESDFWHVLAANFGLGKRLRAWGLYTPTLKLLSILGESRAESLLNAKDSNSRSKAPFEVQSVSGCSMFVKRETFHRIGMFDERYFLYDEDTDISIASNKLGLVSYQVPAFTVFTMPHSTTSKRPEFFRKVRLDSRKKFILKHFKGFKRSFLLASLIFFPKKW